MNCCCGLIAMASGWGSAGLGLSPGTSSNLRHCVATKIHVKMIPSQDSKRAVMIEFARSSNQSGLTAEGGEIKAGMRT